MVFSIPFWQHSEFFSSNDITSGKYKWMDGKDPIAVWNKHKVGLTRSVMDLAGSLGDKPTVFGKDPSLWNYAYMVLSSMEGISLV